LQSFLKSEEIKSILENIKEDVIMVLGWDWTILRAIRKHYKEKKVFLPINFWTKWFLLNDKKYIWNNNEFITNEYPLIDCEVKVQDKIYQNIAFNEVIIKETECQMLDLNISINDKHFLDLQWDWLIVSTPAWSTWYNSSLHGPILPHISNNFVITYKAAWKPKRKTPTIIKNNKIIKIESQNRLSPIWVYIDWIKLAKSENEKMYISIKKSKYKIKILISEKYKKIWDNKWLEEH
jgi:NAD kinase